MRAASVLLRCVGKAVVRNIVNLVTVGVGGDLLVAAWEAWRDASKEKDRPSEVEAVAQLSASELRDEVANVVREEAAGLPPEQQAQVAAYLGQVPAAIRRSLRRPSDPSGRTTAAGTAFRKPEDLLPLLPASLPRFKRGDRPLPGVDWELEELLGVGGFGEVWKARNPHFDGIAPVALKFCLDPAAKERLLKHEAKIINQVMQQGKHEGIVPLLHTYLSADPPCLAYEFVNGSDLTGLLQGRPDGLAARQAGQVIRRLADIVGYAHRTSPPIVHRDLKPANVLVQARPGGEPALRITDFGIGGLAIQQAVAHSRMASRGGEFLTAAVRGSYTPLYASPQQMRGNDPDPRDDVYALGVIWHQLLTGDLTAGRPGGEAWKKRLTDRGMTPPLLALLASCFEDRREDRPDNGAELAAKLGRLLEEPPPSSTPYPEAMPRPEAHWAERRRPATPVRPERQPTPEGRPTPPRLLQAQHDERRERQPTPEERPTRPAVPPAEAPPTPGTRARAFRDNVGGVNWVAVAGDSHSRRGHLARAEHGPRTGDDERAPKPVSTGPRPPADLSGTTIGELHNKGFGRISVKPRIGEAKEFTVPDSAKLTIDGKEKKVVDLMDIKPGDGATAIVTTDKEGHGMVIEVDIKTK